MKVLFEKSFGRDLKKIKDKRLLKQVQETIDQVESLPRQLTMYQIWRKCRASMPITESEWAIIESASKFQRGKSFLFAF